MSKRNEQIRLVKEVMERIEQLHRISTEGDGFRLFTHIVYKDGSHPDGVMLNSALYGNKHELVRSLIQDDNFKKVSECLAEFLMMEDE